MKVIATKVGYWDGLRAPGEVFDVPPGARASWFAPVTDLLVERELESLVAGGSDAQAPGGAPRNTQSGHRRARK